MGIHPTAVVHPAAELTPGVAVGPYSCIGEHVRVGSGTVVSAHVVIEGHTEIGERNRIYPFVTLGTPPQDIGYRGEETRLTIGNDNVFRENVTIHRATTKEERVTVVGSRNYLMAYVHVAHDCRLGDGIIMANGVQLGGHVRIADQVGIGGLAAVHQFVKIGTCAFVGGMSAVSQDIPPFVMATGQRPKLYGINQKGLRRQGFSQETIGGLKKAYQILFRGQLRLSEGIRRVREEIPPFPELELLLGFLEDSKRGITR